ncbi:MAG TPA: sigma-70 family RNA polymerase sigma factor [Candidatus Kapabacteria bacterium]|nr:sigma-70 family RNA polymerase sigma factor [Candidatus Kapabacteria bacterium]
MLDAARNGDKNAFKELIMKYEPQVAKTVIGMLGQGPEAEDIGQETFIRFYRSLNQFKGDSSPGTYITRIAINLSLNELKRRKLKAKIFFQEYKSQKDDDLLNNLTDKNNNYRGEITHAVRQGIDLLDAKSRAVIVLRLIDGYSTAETAKILELPMGTVLSRLARAQKKLKTILQPFLGGES